jgi:peroxiredoxin
MRASYSFDVGRCSFNRRSAMTSNSRRIRLSVAAPARRMAISCITGAMVEVGKKAPAFTLESSEGGKVKLADFAGKVVVLYFYPRDNTPGCTVEAENFRDALPALKKLGAVVLGVSKDSIASHCKFRDKYKLNFPLRRRDGSVRRVGRQGDVRQEDEGHHSFDRDHR